MKLILNPTFAIGDTVYLKVCTDKEAGIITGYTIRQGSIIYLVSWNTGEFCYYDFELTTEFVPDYGAQS